MCIRIKKKKKLSISNSSSEKGHTHTGKKSTNKLRYSGGGSLDGTSSERRLASDRVAPVINYLYNWPIVDDVDDDGDKLVAALTLSLFLSFFILWRPFFFLFLLLQQQQQRLLLLLLRCATWCSCKCLWSGCVQLGLGCLTPRRRWVGRESWSGIVINSQLPRCFSFFIIIQ